MTYYLKNGNRFNVTSKEALDLHKELPLGTYTVKFDMQHGVFFLEKIENLSIEGKIYGDPTKVATRILNTFDTRPNSTGVLLSGEKGTGKTLLAKMLSTLGREQGISTLIINQDHHGEEFNSFMQTIEEPTIVVFDEFEKVYSEEKQGSLLTLLDGVYPSKKMFILTCNDGRRINSHMTNRPGRIFYRKNYLGLDQAFIREYCEDNLKDKSHIEGVVRTSMLFEQFNFDILKAMVEEMNRYEESPREVLQLLNAKPDQGRSSYDVTLYIDNKRIDKSQLYPGDVSVYANPLTETFSISYKLESIPVEMVASPVDPSDTVMDEWDRQIRKVSATSDSDWEDANFSTEHLNKIDPETNEFTFVNANGDRLVLSKVSYTSYDWTSAI